MKLRCIKKKEAYWGDIFIPGDWYDMIETEREVTLITDYDNYYKYVTMISQSILWIRKGYTEENMHEVMPGYITMKEKENRYTIKVKLPYGQLKGVDDHIYSYYLLSDDEIIEKFGLDREIAISKDTKTNSFGRLSFGTTENVIDNFFDYLPTRRDNRLKELGL